ncbi:hypothetical protein Moror_13718 [Moniliophthora roreri MCA 2997]|uniref:Uncharacterized protein n=2 Tax=Moniliophthora roreri TaxID=221103 RepID=V2YFA3_MONRO|nr:hypothetical protein Moror_13718 [Moniliophthora roreri MCA 2997]
MTCVHAKSMSNGTSSEFYASLNLDGSFPQIPPQEARKPTVLDRRWTKLMGPGKGLLQNLTARQDARLFFFAHELYFVDAQIFEQYRAVQDAVAVEVHVAKSMVVVPQDVALLGQAQISARSSPQTTVQTSTQTSTQTSAQTSPQTRAVQTPIPTAPSRASPPAKVVIGGVTGGVVVVILVTLTICFALRRHRRQKASSNSTSQVPVSGSEITLFVDPRFNTMPSVWDRRSLDARQKKPREANWCYNSSVTWYGEGDIGSPVAVGASFPDMVRAVYLRMWQHDGLDDPPDYQSQSGPSADP